MSQAIRLDGSPGRGDSSAAWGFRPRALLAASPRVRGSCETGEGGCPGCAFSPWHFGNEKCRTYSSFSLGRATRR